MSELDSLKSSLAGFKKQLAAKKAEKQGYLDIASKIDAVYDRMAEDKRTIISYRNNVKDFSKEDFDTFKGDLYRNHYKVSVENLIEDYNLVIDRLDTNMDNLNMLKASYENKAYNCNWVIGSLQSSINSLVHTIENWVN